MNPRDRLRQLAITFPPDSPNAMALEAGMKALDLLNKVSTDVAILEMEADPEWNRVAQYCQPTVDYSSWAPAGEGRRDDQPGSGITGPDEPFGPPGSNTEADEIRSMIRRKDEKDMLLQELCSDDTSLRDELLDELKAQVRDLNQGLSMLAQASINAYMAFNLVDIRSEQDADLIRAAQEGLRLVLDDTTGLEWRLGPAERRTS